jgi:hypothetical protein
VSDRGLSWSDFRSGSAAIHSGRPKPEERALADIQRAFLQRFGSLKKAQARTRIHHRVHHLSLQREIVG